MTLALAQDKLHYTPEQMNALSQQVRLGDLTPVMQIYEDDIRSPLKSAVGGTLLRTLLVQVQKAKVRNKIASLKVVVLNHDGLGRYQSSCFWH